ncbi:MAG: glycosyltransferase family 4 protein [Streptosporangiaceae bacterium]|nr:glycosyltransferase family 4 protein [Streptosporangiaceae bacterium]
MRIAFVLGTSGGGTGRHVRMLAAGCSAKGVGVCVFGPAQTERDFRFGETVMFVPVEIAARPRPARDVLAIARLRRLLRSASADAVHAHGLRAGALTAIALAAIRHRPPLIVTVHNAPAAGGVVGAVYRILELTVARRADSVLCVSADLEERMRAAGARRVGRAVVPPSAIAPDVSAETSPPDHPLVLAVGRLATQKGFGVLLEAAGLWRDLRPEPHLMIVGQGPLEAGLKAQAASLGVDAEFAGHRSDVPALLAAADVFVLPSLWEGQALILQEALRAGAPIVATRTGGNPALTGEDAAVLVPPGDAPLLSDAVREVLTDQALAHRLRKAALDRARTLPGEEDAISAALTEYRRHLAHDT